MQRDLNRKMEEQLKQNNISRVWRGLKRWWMTWSYSLKDWISHLPLPLPIHPCCNPPHLHPQYTVVFCFFLYFSGAFSTIQPVFLRNKLERSVVHHRLSPWTTLPTELQCVRGWDGELDCCLQYRGCTGNHLQVHVHCSSQAIAVWWLHNPLPHHRWGWQGVQRTDPGLFGLVPVEPPPDECREDQSAGGGFPQAQTNQEGPALSWDAPSTQCRWWDDNQAIIPDGERLPPDAGHSESTGELLQWQAASP